MDWTTATISPSFLLILYSYLHFFIAIWYNTKTNNRTKEGRRFSYLLSRRWKDRTGAFEKNDADLYEEMERFILYLQEGGANLESVKSPAGFSSNTAEPVKPPCKSAGTPFRYCNHFVQSPLDVPFGLILFLIGLGLLICGIWMLLAGKNRRLYVFENGSLTYMTNWRAGLNPERFRLR